MLTAAKVALANLCLELLHLPASMFVVHKYTLVGTFNRGPGLELFLEGLRTSGGPE